MVPAVVAVFPVTPDVPGLQALMVNLALQEPPADLARLAGLQSFVKK